jgi:RNA polymerase sigma factor (sigma-70 family)
VAADNVARLSLLSETVANVDFPDFFRTEYKLLVRFALSLGASPDLAADVAQTAFERALGAWDTIHYPRAWLRRVTQNELTRLYRAAARETLTDSPPDRSGAVSAAVAVELRTQARDVTAVLAALPPVQRSVMAWYYDGFADAEIAGELGITTDAVRQARSKARRKLRQSFGEGGDGT